MHERLSSYIRFVPSVLAIVAIAFSGAAVSKAEPPITSSTRKVKVLFLGNSFTARHNLAHLVKAMIEAGNPNCKFDVTTVIYGGRTPADHWRLHSQNFVNFSTLTVEQEKASIAALEKMVEIAPRDKYAAGALSKYHRPLLESLAGPRHKWDLVVLQSYRDDMEGERSKFVEFVPKFAELVKAQGGRTILYETTPLTQNERPLTMSPDPRPIREKEAVIRALAQRVDAIVVPMATVALQCQTVRPDLTLRYVNDAHLNKTMAYLTACAFYGALCDRNPQGLPIDTVSDTKSRDAKHPDQDMDGEPLSQKFSPRDAADLQRIAWDGLQEFREQATATGR
ncbi:MAG: SGNH/GDSL hydrolase family protein [Pirellulales bacterium]